MVCVRESTKTDLTFVLKVWSDQLIVYIIFLVDKKNNTIEMQILNSWQYIVFASYFYEAFGLENGMP